MASTSETPPTIARTIPTWTEWQVLAERVAELRFSREKGRSSALNELYTQAMGYAWGWQDALGRGARDTGDAVDFARAYACYAAEYELGERGSRRPIQDAWAAWLKHGNVAKEG